MTRIRSIIYIALFLTLVLILWTGLSLLPGPEYVELPPGEQGSHDLTGLDLDSSVYRLSQMWDAWTDEFHQPDELDTAGDPIPYTIIDHSQISFATYRVRLKLTPDVTYGITQRSSDYAMRLFMDGEEIITVGNPGATEEDNTTQVRDVVHYFTPRQDTVELVVQSSNYVHFRDGTKAPKFVFGTAENIARYKDNKTLKSGIIFGCLMVAFLYHLAIFLLNRRQKASLLFGLLCLMMGLYSADDFVTTTLTVYRLGYVAMILSLAGLVLMAGLLFPGALNKRVARLYYAVCGGYLLLSLTAHTMLVSRVLIGFQAVSIGMIIYYLVCLALTLREKKLKNVLAFLGFALFGLSTVYEMLYKNSLGPNLYINSQRVITSGGGMVLLVCCYALVLAIDQAEVNQKLEEAKAALEDAEARYLELFAASQPTQTETASPANLTDLGLTRRESEVAILLLDGKSREEITGLLSISRGTVNTHFANIYRKAGVKSVTDFIRLMLPEISNGEKN